MKLSAKTYLLIASVAIFLGLPLLFYAMGDTPRRSLVKEVFSILTLLAFTAVLGQFFLARSNTLALSLFKPLQVQTVHKYLAYSALAVILLHPVLIVLPRAFEGGITPWTAFVTMITTFDNLGILAGLAAWVLLVVLGVTAYFRKRLIPHFAKRYRGWRGFHGALAVFFTALAIWHAIDLGRHTDTAMTVLFLSLALIGAAMLAKMYWDARPKPSQPASATQGASA